MKTNIKLAVVAIALVGMSLGAASPILAQRSAAQCPGMDMSGAEQLIQAGQRFVPEASLYWCPHQAGVPEAGMPELIEDVSFLGQPSLNHPAAHMSGAEQLIRAGQRFVPEASLYLSAHVEQESGASQLIRAAGGANVFIPEAALYLGEWMPRSTIASPQAPLAALGAKAEQ